MPLPKEARKIILDINAVARKIPEQYILPEFKEAVSELNKIYAQKAVFEPKRNDVPSLEDTDKTMQIGGFPTKLTVSDPDKFKRQMELIREIPGEAQIVTELTQLLQTPNIPPERKLEVTELLRKELDNLPNKYALYKAHQKVKQERSKAGDLIMGLSAGLMKEMTAGYIDLLKESAKAPGTTKLMREVFKDIQKSPAYKSAKTVGSFVGMLPFFAGYTKLIRSHKIAETIANALSKQPELIQKLGVTFGTSPILGASYGAIRHLEKGETRLEAIANDIIGFTILGAAFDIGGDFAKGLVKFRKKAQISKYVEEWAKRRPVSIEKAKTIGELYSEWIENQRKKFAEEVLQAIEKKKQYEEYLRKSPQGAKLLKEQLKAEQAISDYFKSVEQKALPPARVKVTPEGQAILPEGMTVPEGSVPPEKQIPSPEKTTPDKYTPTTGKEAKITGGDKNAKRVGTQVETTGQEEISKQQTEAERLRVRDTEETGLGAKEEKTPQASKAQKKEKIIIPEFKNTEEAIAFGKEHKGNKEIARELQRREQEVKKQWDEIPSNSEENINKKMKLAVKKQLYREAREVVEGKMPAETKVGKTEAKPKTKPDKQPWEMTRDEYINRGFSNEVREISFKEWAAQKGYQEGKDYASEYQEADFIGQHVLPERKTAREVAKQKSLARLVEKRKKLYSEYEAEVPKKVVYNKELNDAQRRVLTKRHKRIIDQALKEGKPVPERVLKDYPDLVKKGPEKQVKQKSLLEKEPWEMTWEEFLKIYKADPTDITGNLMRLAKLLGKTYDEIEKEYSFKLTQVGKSPFGRIEYDYAHTNENYEKSIKLADRLTKEERRFFIEQALKEGESVPEEVLKEYPDLAKKYGADLPQAETVKKSSEAAPAISKEAKKGAEVSTAKPQQEVGSTPAVPTKAAPKFDESYGYKKIKGIHIFKVMRAGSEKSHTSRGGSWYEVESYKGAMPARNYREGIGGVGGKEIHRGEVELKNPYYFEIPDIKSEGEIPLKLYEEVTGKKVNKRKFSGINAEKEYAKIEKEISTTLQKKGYDGVVLYNKVGENEWPSQIFKFETEAPEPTVKTARTERKPTSKKQNLSGEEHVVEISGVEDEQIKNINTLDDLVNYIKKNKDKIIIEDKKSKTTINPENAIKSLSDKENVSQFDYKIRKGKKNNIIFEYSVKNKLSPEELYEKGGISAPTKKEQQKYYARKVEIKPLFNTDFEIKKVGDHYLYTYVADNNKLKRFAQIYKNHDEFNKNAILIKGDNNDLIFKYKNGQFKIANGEKLIGDIFLKMKKGDKIKFADSFFKQLNNYLEREIVENIIVKAQLSGKEFVKGLVDAIKKDMTDQSLGIVSDPYRNLKEFLASNKIELSKEERMQLKAFASQLFKNKLLSEAKKEEQMLNFVKYNLGKTNKQLADLLKNAAKEEVSKKVKGGWIKLNRAIRGWAHKNNVSEAYLHEILKKVTGKDSFKKATKEDLVKVLEEIRKPAYVKAMEDKKAKIEKIKNPHIKKLMLKLFERQNKIREDFYKRKKEDEDISIFSRRGKKSILGYFVDIRYAFANAEENTGLPFYKLVQNIEMAERTMRKVVDDTMDSLFANSGVKQKEVLGNKKLQDKIKNYIMTGNKDGLEDKYVKLANEIINLFKNKEKTVRKIRFFRWLENPTENKIPNARPEDLKEGRRILFEEGEKAFDEWLDKQTWGTREKYLPSIFKDTADLDDIWEGMFLGSGEGFAKTRTGDYYNNRPLFRVIRRYLYNVEAYERLKPYKYELERYATEAGATGKDLHLLRTYWKRVNHLNFANEPTAILFNKIRSIFWNGILNNNAYIYVRNLFQNFALLYQKMGLWPTVRQGWRIFTLNKKFAKNEELNKILKEYFDTNVAEINGLVKDYMYIETDYTNSKLRNEVRDLVRKLPGLYAKTDYWNRIQAFKIALFNADYYLNKYRNGKIRLNKALRQMGFYNLVNSQQAELLELLGSNKDLEFKKKLAKYITENTHFKYSRSEKGLAEQTVLGQNVWDTFTWFKGNIQNLYKGGIERIQEGIAKKNYDEAYAGIRTLTGYLLAATGTNYLLTNVLGSGKSKYGLEAFAWQFGGVTFGTMAKIFSLPSNFFQMISTGDIRAGYAKAAGEYSINQLARLVPFLDVMMNVYEAANDYRGVTATKLLRKMIINKIKKHNYDLYKRNKKVKFKTVKRTIVEAWQHALFGTNEVPESSKKKVIKIGGLY